MRQLISVLAGGVVLLLLSVVLAGVAPAKLFNAEVMLLVLGPLVGAVILGCPPSLLRAVRAILANDPAVDDASARRVQQAAANLGQLAILTALTGVLLAIIQYFEHLGSADYLNTLISTSALCLAYGFGFKLLIAAPLETLAAQCQPPSDQPAVGGMSAGAAVEADHPAIWQRLSGVALMLAGWVCGITLLGGIIDQFITPSKIILILGLLPLLRWINTVGHDKTTRPLRDFSIMQSNVVLIAGLLGSLLGLMAVAQNLSATEKLGVGLSASSIGIAYGLMIHVLLSAVGLDRDQGSRLSQPLEGVNGYLWGFLLLGYLFIGAMLTLSFSRPT